MLRFWLRGMKKLCPPVGHSEQDGGLTPRGRVLTRRIAHGEKDGAPEAAFSVRPSENLNGMVGSRPAGPLLTRGTAQRREGGRARGCVGGTVAAAR